MLEHAGEEVLRLELDGIAERVLGLHADPLGPQDVAPDSGERKAPLLPPFGPLLLDDLGVYEGDGLAAVPVRACEEQAHPPPDLRRREPDPRFEVEQGLHFGDLPPEIVVESRHGRGLLHEHRIGKIDEFHGGSRGGRVVDARPLVAMLPPCRKQASGPSPGAAPIHRDPLVDVSKYLERADNEARRKNFDGAMDLYAEILRLDADCGEARKGLLVSASRKFEKGYPSAVVTGLGTLGARIGIFFASMFKAHAAVAGFCEGAIRKDPRNVSLNMKLGHALLALNLRRSAEAVFAALADLAPEDTGSLKILGQLLYEQKRHDEAMQCFERVLRINPRDQEAAKMRKNLAAEGAIAQAGFKEAKSARDLAKSQKDLGDAERRQRLSKTAEDLADAVLELERALEQSPGDVGLTIKLGRAKLEAADYDGAVDAFLDAVRADASSEEAKDGLGDARLARARKNLDHAKSSGVAEDIARRTRELASLELDEIRRRSDARPTDLGLRFRLGKALLEAGDTDDAIKALQQGVKDPRHRVSALHLLGRAFAESGSLDLAVKQFSEAADAITSLNGPKMEILYELACTLERQGGPERLERALRTFETIFEADIGFKDVRAKVEDLRKKLST